MVANPTVRKGHEGWDMLKGSVLTWPPFTIRLSCELRRPTRYGWCWDEPAYYANVIAPIGLNVLYGGCYAFWLAIIVGFGGINMRLRRKRK